MMTAGFAIGCPPNQIAPQCLSQLRRKDDRTARQFHACVVRAARFCTSIHRGRVVGSGWQAPHWASLLDVGSRKNSTQPTPHGGLWVGSSALRDPTLFRGCPMLGLVRTRPNLQQRRASETEKDERGHKRLEALCAVSLKVKFLVVEKALARAKPDPALAHVALDDCGRGIALVAQRLGEVPARLTEDAAAAPT